MKKTLIIISIIVFLTSCALKKKEIKTANIDKSLHYENLDTILLFEKELINEFLKLQLNTNTLKPYKNIPIAFIKEASGVLSPLNDYEYSYNQYIYQFGKVNKSDWILDSTQVQKYKMLYKNEKRYVWQKNDFEIENFSIISTNDLKKSIQQGTYTDLPRRLIVYLSRPLIIDKKNILISFTAGNSSFGFSTVVRHTVLMKKKDGVWTFDNFFYGNIYD